jgi:transposase-like protein
MAAPRRAVKLPYRELNIACPHCRAPLTIGTVMDTIRLSRRTCPKCGKEFLIENDVAKKPDGRLKKPSGSVKPVRAVKRAKSR